MTTMQGSGVVDMSGVISSILKSYQDVLTNYQTMVTGDPDAVTRAGTTLEDQAGTLASVSGDIGQRSTTLAGSWSGSAADAFGTASAQLTGEVDGVTQAMRREAERLTEAATLLRTGKSQVDSVVGQFQQAAQTLINESRTAAVGAVNAFVQAAQQLGTSATGAAKTTTDKVGEELGSLFGVEAEGDEEGKHLGSSDVELGKKTWSKLDGSMKSDLVPWSWSKSFGTPVEKTEPTSTAGKLWKDTSITLASSGDKTLYDGSLVDDKADTKADLGAWGTAKAKAEFDAGLRVTDKGDLSVHGNQFQASGEVKATLADASASGSYTEGPLSAHASTGAMVGADAAAKLSAGTSGFSGHLDAFAGGEVKGSVGADVAGVGLGASGSLQAGVGFSLDGDATYDNGHFVLSGKVGAALGLGASGSVKMDIDVPKLVNTAEQYGGSAVQAVENAAGSIGYAAGQAATAIGNAYMNAGPYGGVW